MPKFRVVPSILTNGTSQVKGSVFNNWRTVGSVVQAIKVHGERDVDEILLLDVNATNEGRLVSSRLVARVSPALRVPLAVGGGIRGFDDVAELLSAGADKVVIGTAAIETPELVARLAAAFGSQAIVCAVDAVDDEGEAIAIRSGSVQVKQSPASVSKVLEQAGAGEILLQNISRDGVLGGMDLNLLLEVSKMVSIPVILGSGASKVEDFYSAHKSGASAVSAGSLFQFTEVTPLLVKKFLKSKGVPTRT